MRREEAEGMPGGVLRTVIKCRECGESMAGDEYSLDMLEHILHIVDELGWLLPRSII
jgi:hypothetical protein